LPPLARSALPRRPRARLPRDGGLAGLGDGRGAPCVRAVSPPPLLLAVPLLALALLLPEHGFGLWLRLAAATLVLLLPGRLVARALGRRGPAAAFVWSVGLVAAALAFTFALHGSLTLVLVLALPARAVALPFQRRPATEADRPRPGLVPPAGLRLGIP